MTSPAAEITARIIKKTSHPRSHQLNAQSTWISPEQVLSVADAIKSVSEVTEERFLEIGERLSSSVEILERLTTLFSQLQVELDSPEMQGAIEGLTRVAAQLPLMIGAQRDERAALEQLSKLAGRLGRRIDEIQEEFRTIEVLTVNARITASNIGSAGADFLTYIGEIGDSLKVTEAKLRQFRNDLMQVSRHLCAASATEAEFESHHAKTVAVIPDALAQSLELITTRRAAAAIAAGSVSTRSEQVSSGIARVIVALQIGDATRQRMEHAQEAAKLVALILAPDRALDAVEELWAALPEIERQALAAAGCALQSAQLADAADELRQEVGSVHSALAELAANTDEIVRLSKLTFGSNAHDGAFLEELEGDVQQARALFEGFREARASADQTMDAVLTIVSRLADHIGTVRNVERDIRMMGVNATLKSGRLGNTGAALSVVAAEVTNSSARTAIEAKTATEDVEAMVVTARSLGGEQQAARLADIEAVTELMEKSTARLRGVADGLASAFDSLARDGLAVVDLLDRTATSLAATDEIDAGLRRAAANFEAITLSAPDYDLQPTAARRRMFELIAARYSMAREREIHAKLAPGTPLPPLPAAAAQTVDDMLF